MRHFSLKAAISTFYENAVFNGKWIRTKFFTVLKKSKARDVNQNTPSPLLKKENPTLIK